MHLFTRGALAALLTAVLALPAWAQDAPTAADAGITGFDLGKTVRQTHLHQIFGFTTLGLAVATPTAALLHWEGHPILGYTMMGTGLATLALGLTAYGDQLDEVWPHAAFMALAETGWLLNAFVLEPGSLPHKINGALSLVNLAAGFTAILLIRG